ncbi:MAG: hypothetical protein KAU28_03310, partial [Phycisphaerae bacterium]|nr:hypothetical protein [Phycisphaerae bacterium]
DTGTGSFTAMGLCDYASAAGEEKLLWRAAWVLNEGTPSQASDCWNLDFADVQKCARADLNTEIDTLRDDSNYVPSSLAVPPDTLVQINVLWKYLAERCTKLSIMWTDGKDNNGDGSLDWFGVDYVDEDTGYEAKGQDSITKLPSDEWKGKTIDNNTAEFSKGVLYRALWTNDNQNNWPRAIKIGFTLIDESKSLGTLDFDYEIICPLK